MSVHNKLKDIARTFFSYLPSLGLIKKPHFHEEGISVVIPVKDEEEWIEPSILSVQDVADEIIVIDSSVEDNTTKIVERLADRNDKIRHVRFYCEAPNSFALACHIGLVVAHFKWMFKWDSDCVARSSQALMDWRERIMNLDKNKYYVIQIPRINLEGDLFHQPRDCPFGGYEGRIFTWSPELRCVLKNNDIEYWVGDSIWGYRFPPWYKKLRWDDAYVFHCNIKNPRRMLLRMFWSDWMAINDYKRFPTLEDYALYRIRNEWKMDSLDEAVSFFSKKSLDSLVPYDKKRFGDYPELLKSKLEKETQKN